MLILLMNRAPHVLTQQQLPVALLATGEECFLCPTLKGAVSDFWKKIVFCRFFLTALVGLPYPQPRVWEADDALTT